MRTRRPHTSTRFITFRERVLLRFLGYWDCELFYEGVKALGIIGAAPYYWDCELFQIGLKELDLA